MLYDVIIIGGGPAGVAASVYCARKQLNTLLLTESFGGQSIVAADIQNWIGEAHISGYDLAKKLENHVRAFSDIVQIITSEKAKQISEACCDEKNRSCNFEVKTDKGRLFKTKSVILASGARRRRLGVPGEDEYEGKGVSYCSTCDAPIFNGKNVAVIGGGNAGLETVIDLFPYAKHIYLLERSDSLRGDAITRQKVKNSKKVDIMFQTEVLKIVGKKFVEKLVFKNLASNQEQTLHVGGVFVAIGSVPNSEIVKGLLDRDKFGQVITDGKHATTSRAGIFAAGDVTDDPYKQNMISAGDGTRAALAAYFYLQQRKKNSPASG